MGSGEGAEKCLKIVAEINVFWRDFDAALSSLSSLSAKPVSVSKLATRCGPTVPGITGAGSEIVGGGSPFTRAGSRFIGAGSDVGGAGS